MTSTLLKKRPSDELLDELIGVCKSLKEQVQQEFASLSNTQLKWSPDKTSWSINQCLIHLNAFHRFYVPLFEERVQNSRFREPRDYFQSSPMGNSTYLKVKLGKLNNVKRKLKSPKDYNPLVNTNLNTPNVFPDFFKFLEELINVLEAAKSINIRKTKSPFSVRPIVKLRLGDAFQYIVYHCERHVEQARKVKQMSKFPS